MAKRDPNNMLKCDLNTEFMLVTFYHAVKDSDGKFGTINEAVDRREYLANNLPDAIRNACTVYGLRAYLADRTSDLRALGIPAVLEGMDGVYEQFLDGQLKKTAVARANTVNAALVQLITELKNVTAVQAESALKGLSKEQREAISVKHIGRLNAIREEQAQAAREAEAVDLGDLF